MVEPFLNKRRDFIAHVVKPLQNKIETVYALPGSDVEEHVSRNFPHKTIKYVGNGTRPLSIQGFLNALPLVFQRNKSEGMNHTYHFTFKGNEELKATVTISDRKVHHESGHKGEPDVHVYADSRTWLKFLHKEQSIFTALMSRKVKVKGKIRNFKKLGECFGV